MARPRTLVGRMFLWQFVAVLAILMVLGWVLDRALEHRAVESLTSSLSDQAAAMAAMLPNDSALDALVEEAAGGSDTRITVVDVDGTVLADSEADASAMENHAERPEVAAALAGNAGEDKRLSATTGTRTLYVAVPWADGAVRVAVPLTEVAERQRAIRLTLILGFVLAALVAGAGAILVARGVLRPLRAVGATVDRMGEGDLAARAPQGGPEEVARFAEALNTMAERIERASSAREQARSTLDLILTSMGEGVTLFSADGTTAFYNPAMRDLLNGVPASSGSLTPEALRAAVLAAAAGATEEVEVDVGTPGRWLQVVATPVETGGVLLVARDVTQSHRIESVRRDFVANASHELKTPAATIQATAETLLIAADEDPGSVPRFAQRMESEALRLSRIVSDLLDLSRLESGGGFEERLDLEAVVREEVERSRSDAERAGVGLTVEAEAAEVMGSRDDLGLLVRNLVSNGINYTKEGGSVRVRLEREGPEGVLRVSDDGIGIPSRDLDRVFERFYRVDRARSRETGGTGLGLSLVRHVAENHGGSVSAESELGRGSTFTVRLPAI